ncbi:hypothetical protein [Amycolatopsis sp. Hca4]|uniref:hypothetical protein n=1 Tax=Amycolatopsis sp. Hca4 TaxID=2742131 RepID=UPI001C37BFB4|nr:hypothetical protein [Amycolatopsis sp. Hca4]
MSADTRLEEPAFSGSAARHRRETFAGRPTVRAWLYRIAADACLDLPARCRQEPAAGGDVPWLRRR